LHDGNFTVVPIAVEHLPLTKVLVPLARSQRVKLASPAH
jgi:hypothetical protein